MTSGNNNDRSTLPLRAVGEPNGGNLARRRHQDGQLIELEHGWALRVYEDYCDGNGVRLRRRVQKFLGDLKTLPTRRAAQNAMAAELILVNSRTARPQTTIIFRQQATLWMDECRRRRWKPIKPSVLKNWQGALDNHILPIVGSMCLSDVNNRALKTLVETLTAKDLKPGSIRSCIRVFKSVVAGAEDADGNKLYPVVWNRRFTPAINPTLQRRPTFTSEELGRLVNGTTGRLQMAVILLASSGLRIGELLGLECKHFEGLSLRIEQAAWGGKIQSPKTVNAYRTVELDPGVAALLNCFIGLRSKGFIFETRSGRPLNTRNFARLLHSSLERLKIPKRGFHSFRRFRNAYLQPTLSTQHIAVLDGPQQ